MFEPLTKKTLVESITHTLMEMIAKGELRAGDALPSERELASMLNVSRSSVREALKALAFNDIVIIKPGSGTYLSDKLLSSNSPFFSDAEEVFSFYRTDYKQIVEARRVLEVDMAAFAAQRIQEKGLEDLRASLERMEELLTKEVYDSYTMEDLSFHNTIALNCGNDYLYKSFNQLFPCIVDISRLGETVPDRHWPSYHQHISIYQAIQSRDVEAVRSRMADHICFCEENIDLFFGNIQHQ